jgi:Mor family transcriptional regulator|tara:strand:+ start:669 stop:866 length:198 start_codon:yes stop_codon:yes gene_type:complete
MDELLNRLYLQNIIVDNAKKTTEAEIKQRDKLMCETFAQGIPVQTIAKKLKLSRQRVYKILLKNM